MAKGSASVFGKRIHSSRLMPTSRRSRNRSRDLGTRQCYLANRKTHGKPTTKVWGRTFLFWKPAAWASDSGEIDFTTVFTVHKQPFPTLAILGPFRETTWWSKQWLTGSMPRSTDCRLKKANHESRTHRQTIWRATRWHLEVGKNSDSLDAPYSMLK